MLVRWSTDNMAPFPTGTHALVQFDWSVMSLPGSKRNRVTAPRSDYEYIDLGVLEHVAQRQWRIGKHRAVKPQK